MGLILNIETKHPLKKMSGYSYALEQAQIYKKIWGILGKCPPKKVPDKKVKRKKRNTYNREVTFLSKYK